MFSDAAFISYAMKYVNGEKLVGIDDQINPTIENYVKHYKQILILKWIDGKGCLKHEVVVLILKTAKLDATKDEIYRFCDAIDSHSARRMFMVLALDKG